MKTFPRRSILLFLFFINCLQSQAAWWLNDVTDVSKNQISDSPKLAKDTTNGFIVGIATLLGEAVMLLDTVKILSDDDETSNQVM